MPDDQRPTGNVNISDISGGETNVGPIVTGTVNGDVVGRDKVLGDKVSGNKIINFFRGGTTEARDHRNRQALLTLVENFWVKGVLQNSLHGAVLIELELEERQEAVEYPWEMVLQRPDQENRTLPQDVKMAKLFDEVSQNVLILGEPGSGKTTMLLELARETITRARDDETQPIPVVFNLSSWNDLQQSMADWLVVELNAKYNIPKKIAQSWIDDGTLLLLLDGLDEVIERLRDSCVQAINDFRQEHLMPLVVCSRIADYERLEIRLKLDSAILIKPLTSEQIEEYLNRDSLGFAVVRATLQRDKSFQELAKSPLLLSIMGLVFKDVKGPAFNKAFSAAFDSPASRRKHLFDAYIERMFERRGANPPYRTEQTIRWLTWLARGMRQASLTIFLIERMQPSWLTTRRQRQTYSITSMLIVGLIVGLFFGLIGGLSGGGGLSLGLFFGLIGGLSGGIGVGLSSGDIELVEKLEWSWKDARYGLIGGLVFGLCFLCAGGLNDGVYLALIFGLLVGLIGGWRRKQGSVDTSIMPNQGIWQSGKNALSIFLLYDLIFGLIFGLTGVVTVELNLGLSVGLGIGLFFGSIFGLIFGLIFGGVTFIRHFTLRFILWWTGQLPWRYADFLDYAAERIFLRKVGGGYVFIHRLLLEHIATMAEGTAHTPPNSPQ